MLDVPWYCWALPIKAKVLNDLVSVPTGLPPTGSWQDLKDHMREAGDVCFTDVQRDGEGVVEFLRREDMEYAMRCLNRTEFRSHQVTKHSDPQLYSLEEI